jgi:hypothetical protein
MCLIIALMEGSTMGEDSQMDSAAVLARLDKVTSALENLTQALRQLESTPRRKSSGGLNDESDRDADAGKINSRFCDDEKIRATFIRDELKRFRKSPETIANTIYRGERWGPFHKNDPVKSSWRVREANRYITEIYRQRELRPVQYSILIGLVAVATAILAIPWGDSIFAQLRHLLGK